MHRIDSNGAVSVRPTPAVAGTVSGFFGPGDLQARIAPTTISRDWLNDIQEELAQAIESAGLTLTKGQYQLALALRIQTFKARVGEIIRWAGTTPPPYSLPADGRNVLRSAYPELFAMIGTTQGAGDGSTTFSLPDARNDNVNTPSLKVTLYIIAGR